ncbi:ABC transporter transmembrane domain-containing protein [Streptacidiphilus cavernicola]|uniref:ABC transporter transmembrane domain-containing protein n=1 Tax=Streptacidiphilus cavernicola TaxID=3342716 RepID=A0ABV6VZU9_9ACTN
MIDSYKEPGVPDRRSAIRYLWWLVTSQRGRVALAMTLGSVWMVGLTLPPYLLSRAIDQGLQPGNEAALIGWSAALLLVGAVNAWIGIMRHRTMTRIRMDANFRTVKVVVGQAVRLGAALPRQVTSGEVVTIGIGDVRVISQALTVTGPGVGSVVAYLVVAALLLSVSSVLAVVVLLGVPLLALLVGPLMGRLQRTETSYRERQGELAARIQDLAGGLRVLNGLGGKGLYAGNYRRESRLLQAEGYRVGTVTSWIQAFGVGLPTLFLAVVTWLAARMAAQGEISVGQLVAVYGYVAVLVVPVSFFIEGSYDISRALVTARRVIRFLALELGVAEAEAEAGEGAGAGRDVDAGVDAPVSPSVLDDPVSGVRVLPGQLTALVSARAAESADVVDRLARFAATEATWGGVRLDRVALPQVRDRILVADNEADLFAGTLREILAGRCDRDEEAVLRAVHTAMAEDVVRGLPQGLDTAVDAQGRNLSGGQRQRIRLARALLAEPEVLMAMEPTSAVDAHTEAAIATRLREARAGRATVVSSTSPLLLDQADTVFYLVDGKVSATGSHRELLRDQPGYRTLVSREEVPTADEGVAAGGVAADGAADGRAAGAGLTVPHPAAVPDPVEPGAPGTPGAPCTPCERAGESVR